jgi:hypothetical protein
VDNGLLQGDRGKIDPQGLLTRAQMAAVLVRAFGAEKREADLGAYRDADENAWYYKELGSAVSIGLFEGDGTGTIRPNASITREETATVLSRAFKLAGTAEDIAGKKDAADVSSWAMEGVAGLLKAGKMEGYEDGSLKPKSSITREEFAQLMMKLVALYITEPGEYELDIDGTVVVRAPGATLKNSKITGDLILGAEVAREDIEIDETTEIGGRILLITESIGEGDTPTGDYEEPPSTTTGGSSSGSGSGSGNTEEPGPEPQPTPSPIPGRYTLEIEFPAFTRTVALGQTQHDRIARTVTETVNGQTVTGTGYASVPFWYALMQHVQEPANKAALQAAFANAGATGSGIFSSITSGADLNDIAGLIGTLNRYLSVRRNNQDDSALAAKLKNGLITLADLVDDDPFTLRFKDNKITFDIAVNAISGAGTDYNVAGTTTNDGGHQLRTTVAVTAAAGTGVAPNLVSGTFIADSVSEFISANYAVGDDIDQIITVAPFIGSIKAALGGTVISGTSTKLSEAKVNEIGSGWATVTQTVGTGTVSIRLRATQNP